MSARHRSATQSHLELRARQCLSAPSWPEAVLFGAIRGRRLGVQFRRQRLLCAKYIVDFVAPAARLVVEVDGRQHARRRLADARRDKALARAGYRVLRLPAELVLADLPAAVAAIREALAEAADRGGC